jgi:hypothetical protein
MGGDFIIKIGAWPVASWVTLWNTGGRYRAIASCVTLDVLMHDNPP